VALVLVLQFPVQPLLTLAAVVAVTGLTQPEVQAVRVVAGMAVLAWLEERQVQQRKTARSILEVAVVAALQIVAVPPHLVQAVPALSSSNTPTPTAQPSAAVSHKPQQPQAATKSAQ